MNSDNEKPQGVGGWLAFLIFTMLVIGPVLDLVGMAAFGMAGLEFPAVIKSEQWSLYKRAEWIALLIFCSISISISIYGGFGLLKKRTPNAVTTAKVVLWFNGPIAVIIYGIVLPAMMPSNAGIDTAEVVASLLSSLVYLGIWTAYLSQSKRVRNTYGLNSVSAQSVPQPSASEARFDGQPRKAAIVQTQPNVVDVEKSKISAVAPKIVGNIDSIVDDDAIYTQIAQELETGVKDKGLWTRLFADTDGDEQKTRARYIKHRAEKLMAAQQAHLKEQAKLRAEENAKLERQKQLAIDGLSRKTGRCPNSRCEAIMPLTSARCPKCCADFSFRELKPLTLEEADKYEQEEQLAYDALPKGLCPNCKKRIPLESAGCPHCKALFENGAAWKVIPLKQ